MSFPCIPEAGFFDSPAFLSFALHFTTSISTPIHILGLYFLIFKTPDYMKTVRWYMVNLHTWIILFDYSVGILTVPIVLLPSFAGYSFGVLTTFNVPNLYQALLVLNCLGCKYRFIICVELFIFRCPNLHNGHIRKPLSHNL